jgi:universal stress protein A
MFRHILCPIDFTTFSHTALAHAVMIARAHGAAVTGLHVMAAPTAQNLHVPKWTTEDLSRMEAQVLKVLREAGAPSPRALAVAGDPAFEIEKVVSALPADLVVMPIHGWKGLMTGACGSVTEHVLCHARAPIMIVPDSSTHLTPACDGGFHRIVCGIDFSPAAVRALRYAGVLASADRGHLIVTHVVSGNDNSSTAMTGRDAQDPNSPSALWRQRVHLAADTDIPPGVSVQERVQVGDPAAEILRLAGDEQSELIVIGGHRGHPPGCVMSAVVAGASCPVLVIRVCPRLDEINRLEQNPSVRSLTRAAETNQISASASRSPL